MSRAFTSRAALALAFAGLCGVARTGSAAADSIPITSLSDRFLYITFTYPGHKINTPLGINNLRQIAGYYEDKGGVDHGYVWSNGVFTTIDYPGAASTGAGGINDAGDVSGLYWDGKGFQHGFLMTHPASCAAPGGFCVGTFQSLDAPGAVQDKTVDFEFGKGLGTLATGINNRGDVVGMFATPGLYSDAFVRSGRTGRWTAIDGLGADHKKGDGSKAFSVNDHGVVGVNTLRRDPVTHQQITYAALRAPDGGYTLLTVPGSEAGGFGTQVNAVNNKRTAGLVFSDGAGTYHAGLWIGGVVYNVDYPGQALYNEVNGMNNNGDFTGDYSSDGKTLTGFLALRLKPLPTP